MYNCPQAGEARSPVILFLFIIKASFVQAIETPAAQGILYDYETKDVIFEKNADELMSPSSMSKIMTIYYLIFLMILFYVIFF